VQAGQGFGRGDQTLPADAVKMVSRIGPVTAVSSIATVDATVRRTDAISEGINGGITVFAADKGLLTTLNASLADGEWLDDATGTYPAVVLGSVAAQKLGIVDVADELRVRIGDDWFAVIGILNPVPAAEGSTRRDHRHRRRRDLHREGRHRPGTDLRAYRRRCDRRGSNRAAAHSQPRDA
jgi:putative ABC transport system permease protein